MPTRTSGGLYKVNYTVSPQQYERAYQLWLARKKEGRAVKVVETWREIIQAGLDVLLPVDATVSTNNVDKAEVA
jgi:hypothetical protein